MSGFGLWILGFGLWISGFELLILGFGLWILGFGLWILGFIWTLDIEGGGSTLPMSSLWTACFGKGKQAFRISA